MAAPTLATDWTGEGDGVSWNDGGTWFYMQDGTEAIPCKLTRLADGSPDLRYCVTDKNTGGNESFTWTTPLESVPDAAYLLRVEAFHRTDNTHYAFKMDRFDVSR